MESNSSVAKLKLGVISESQSSKSQRLMPKAAKYCHTPQDAHTVDIKVS